MKKLSKLVISPDKVMKNEELINLQGGYLNCEGEQLLFNCLCDGEWYYMCRESWPTDCEYCSTV